MRYKGFIQNIFFSHNKPVEQSIKTNFIPRNIQVINFGVYLLFFISIWFLLCMTLNIVWLVKCLQERKSKWTKSKEYVCEKCSIMKRNRFTNFICIWYLILVSDIAIPNRKASNMKIDSINISHLPEINFIYQQHDVYLHKSTISLPVNFYW